MEERMHRSNNYSYAILFIGLLLNSLSSVSVFSVPLPWLGTALLIVSSLFYFGFYHRRPYFLLMGGMLVCIALIFNLFNWEYYATIYPPNTTTDYPVYWLLRYFTIVGFFAALAIVHRACETRGVVKVESLVVNLAVFVSFYAIYSYASQLLGWPEILPRSRLGTAGGEQSTVYTYAFHRAAGSFREPSHLAEWLMLPLVLAFYTSSTYLNWKVLLIGAAMLLTGSLTGIISLALGLIFTLMLFFSRSFIFSPTFSGFTSFLKGFVRIIAVVCFLILLLNAILGGLLIHTVVERSLSVISGGMEASNRGYIYEYIDILPAFPFLGMGLGNIQIALTNHMGSSEIVSVLNLYYSFLHGTGLVGFIFLMGILVLPLSLIVVHKITSENRVAAFFLLWGYMAWLVAYSVHSEELSLMFSVAYGLILYRIRDPVKGYPRAEKPDARDAHAVFGAL